LARATTAKLLLFCLEVRVVAEESFSALNARIVALLAAAMNRFVERLNSPRLTASGACRFACDMNSDSGLNLTSNQVVMPPRNFKTQLFCAIM
jgi:hypothetical protein